MEPERAAERYVTPPPPNVVVADSSDTFRHRLSPSSKAAAERQIFGHFGDPEIGEMIV